MELRISAIFLLKIGGNMHDKKCAVIKWMETIYIYIYYGIFKHYKSEEVLIFKDFLFNIFILLLSIGEFFQ
jgi:hypothetical protein